MKYALGNMLNGAGGLNADQLALDLQFALDKTLTARKGPTPSFTRASTGTFVGSNGLIQTAAVNVARFDHNPVTGASLGLRHEASATNRLLQSENFGTTWSASELNTTGWLNVSSSPDGQTTANKIIANTTNATHQVRQDVTLATNTTYTLSCYFKASEHTFATLAVFGTANGNVDWTAYFNLSTGVVGASNGFTWVTIFNAGNGWYRCVASLRTTAAGTLNIRLGSSTGSTAGSDTFVGNNANGIFAWGAQLENGENATTYIPTTTSTVIRSADLCNFTGSGFSSFFNASEGSWVLDANSLGADFNPIVQFELSTNVGQNRMYISSFSRGTGYEYNVIANGTGFMGGSLSGTVSGRTARFSIAYAVGNGVHIRNGSIINTSTTLPSSLPYNRVGFHSFNDSTSANGCIASFRYYRRRLSNAKLQALTA